MSYTPIGSGLTQGSTDGNGFTTGTYDTTGANSVFVVLASYDGAALPTVSDNKGNGNYPHLTTYTPNGRVTIFYFEGGTFGSGHTFTVSGTSNFPSISVQAFSGSVASPFDAGNDVGATTASSTTLQPGSVLPGATNTLVVSGLCFGASETASIDSGFSTPLQTNYSGGTHFGVALSYLIETSIASQNPTWTVGSATGLVAAIAVFKAADSVAPTPTRFYLPSSPGTAAVFPAYGSGWTNTASMSTNNQIQTDTVRTGSLTFAHECFGISSVETLLNGQYVSKPMTTGQILAGKVSGQAICDSDAGDPANSINIAVAIRVVKRDGSDYSPVHWLVGPTPAASVSTSQPPCIFPGHEINRSLRNSADSLAISYPPSGVTTAAGDRLVIEIGSSNIAVSNFVLRRGDDSGTDLPVDDTEVTRFNPWVEFSQTLAFESTNPTGPFPTFRPDLP